MEQERHQLLMQFEERNLGAKCTPTEFFGELELVPAADFQLEVIAVDIELALTRGSKPGIDVYLSDFPWLADEIPRVYAEVVETFVRSFCPIRSRKGDPLTSTDDYEIGEEIGRGGMGVVYHAVQKSVGRNVALKVLFLSRSEIFSEAKKLASLNHRNICRIYEAGCIGDFPFMAMQLIYGESLSSQLKSKKFSIEETLRIIIPLADALASAHRSNIVHFDVKPDNILIDANGQSFLTDFGLARKRSELTLEAGSLQPVSPLYCSPEQLSLQFGERGIHSDMYSLGLILYEMLTGRRAYYGDLSQILDLLRNDPPRRPTDYDPQIVPELESICLRAIEKQPSSRFGSMADFREALVTAAVGQGIQL